MKNTNEKQFNFENIEQAFQVLGAAQAMPFDQIKKEYRNLAQVFHPDKYEAGSSRQEWAKEKLIHINNAYELLKDFYAEHPDGVIPAGWKEAQNNNAGQKQTQDGSAASVDPDEAVDWQDWQGSTFADDMTLEEWEKRQQLRQEQFKTERNQNVKASFIRYSKVAAVLFVVMLWTGRVTSHDLEKTSIETNWSALKDRQAYDRDHGGMNIDGTAWSDWELEKRFVDQDTQLIAESDKHSELTQLTGWCTVLFTLAVLVFVCLGVPGRLVEIINSRKKGGDKNA